VIGEDYFFGGVLLDPFTNRFGGPAGFCCVGGAVFGLGASEGFLALSAMWLSLRASWLGR
jgi:hypothetical protein